LWDLVWSIQFNYSDIRIFHLKYERTELVRPNGLPSSELLVVMVIPYSEANVATDDSFLFKKNSTVWKPIPLCIIKEHFPSLPFQNLKRSPHIVHLDNDWHFSLYSFLSANVPLNWIQYDNLSFYIIYIGGHLSKGHFRLCSILYSRVGNVVTIKKNNWI
jgi:hypothetical protein